MGQCRPGDSYRSQLLKTGRSTYVQWDTHQVKQRQGQRPTGSGLYGLEGSKGGPFLMAVPGLVCRY
jgi:hypothetical protein